MSWTFFCNSHKLQNLKLLHKDVKIVYEAVFRSVIPVVYLRTKETNTCRKRSQNTTIIVIYKGSWDTCIYANTLYTTITVVFLTAFSRRVSLLGCMWRMCCTYYEIKCYNLFTFCTSVSTISGCGRTVEKQRYVTKYLLCIHWRILCLSDG